MSVKTARPPVAVVLALLLAAGACRTARAPYAAPAREGAPLLEGAAPARLLVLVVTDTDPRVTPPWIETAERAGDAIAAALAQGGFRTTRTPWSSWNVRVAVSAPLRGADLSAVVDAGGKVLERLEVNGDRWSREELAELGQAVRQRLERSEAIARLAGVEPPAQAAPAAPAAAQAGPAPAPSPAPLARKRLAVLDFRGAVPPQVLAVLADQARAAAADAGRTSGATVMTREGVLAALAGKGRPAAPCADAACDLEAARAGGADLAVTGEVSTIGPARVLVLNLVDVASGTLVASRQAQGKDDLELVEAARPAAAALFR